MGTPDLHHVGKGSRLLVERVAQGLHSGYQSTFDLADRGQVHGRGKGVVGRLGAIDVVVRVHRLLRAELAPEKLDGAVADDLIGVHVALGAAPRLPDHRGEARRALPAVTSSAAWTMA